jgi:tetratricopeptide (TPR) repeat protein
VPRDEASERQRIEDRTVETWVDEGSIRSEAQQAARRASDDGGSSTTPNARGEVDPEVATAISDAVGDRRGERLAERLAAASQALDRERFDEARRLVTPLLREIHGVAAVHEIAGLANYRLGRWKQAAAELETARSLKESVDLLPVLADSYRALGRWADVDRIWNHVKAISPHQEVTAEARIVAAGALGDRGELKAAIAVLEAAQKPPKRVRPYHLRQWYALADLYDRGGDTVSATRWFRRVAEHDPQFVDVRERLRSLGR